MFYRIGTLSVVDAQFCRNPSLDTTRAHSEDEFAFSSGQKTSAEILLRYTAREMEQGWIVINFSAFNPEYSMQIKFSCQRVKLYDECDFPQLQTYPFRYPLGVLALGSVQHHSG